MRQADYRSIGSEPSEISDSSDSEDGSKYNEELLAPELSSRPGPNHRIRDSVSKYFAKIQSLPFESPSINLSLY